MHGVARLKRPNTAADVLANVETCDKKINFEKSSSLDRLESIEDEKSININNKPATQCINVIVAPVQIHAPVSITISDNDMQNVENYLGNNQEESKFFGW